MVCSNGRASSPISLDCRIRRIPLHESTLDTCPFYPPVVALRQTCRRFVLSVTLDLYNCGGPAEIGKNPATTNTRSTHNETTTSRGVTSTGTGRNGAALPAPPSSRLSFRVTLYPQLICPSHIKPAAHCGYEVGTWRLHPRIGSERDGVAIAWEGQAGSIDH